MSDNIVSKIFDRLDAWRHLPSYQLERRADIFFSLYLREVLQNELSMPLKEHIIPEFPVRIGVIDQKKGNPNQSYKVDYLAISEDMSTAILVELKTDQGSQRDGQDGYLNLSREVGIHKLIDGAIKLSEVTNAKQKYHHLLEHLERTGMIKITHDNKVTTKKSTNPVTNRVIYNTTPQGMKTIVAYILPTKEDKEYSTTITFKEFDSVVSRYDDPLSKRFSASLKEWAEVTAGAKI